MEPMFYEVRPWAFVALGIYSVLNSANSSMLLFSGALLAGASFLIIYARSKARHGAR
jgi:hypothetical protein